MGSKEELKQDLVDMTDVAFDEVDMGDELDTEILALKNLRQNIVGKSDEEVAAMMDKNGDGVLSKEELKQDLVDMTDVAFDEVDIDELNLVWDSLVGPKETIDIEGSSDLGEY